MTNRPPTMTDPKTTRRFLPADLEVGGWSDIRPYFEELAQRSLDGPDDLDAWVLDLAELSAVLSEDAGWRYIRTSVDTTDEAARDALQTFHAEIAPKMQEAMHELNQKLDGSPFRDTLPDTLRNFVRGVAIQIRLFREENVEIEKAMNLKTQEYARITGDWSIEWDGEEFTMQQASTFLERRDRDVRRAVYDRMATRRGEDIGRLDDLLDELVAMRHELARNADFDTYRDYKHTDLQRLDYTPADAVTFDESLVAVLPEYARRMDEMRQELLDLDQLKPWDMAVDPFGDAPLRPFDGTEQMMERSVEVFGRVDPYFADCLRTMDEMGHLDLESRRGKAPGGFNMPLGETGVPFIFMNHANSEGDIRVIMHEGGHAVHSFLSGDLRTVFEKRPPSEVNELASMAMELFTMKHWDVFYPDPDHLRRAKRNHLMGILRILPSVAKGDLFQHWMYLNPEHSAAERQAEWVRLSDAIGSGLVDHSDHPAAYAAGYQRILHFYQVPFYYIEYGMAQLGALALWRNYEADPDATIEAYKKALRLGYSAPIGEIYEAAGIRFDFSEATIRELVDHLWSHIEELA